MKKSITQIAILAVIIVILMVVLMFMLKSNNQTLTEETDTSSVGVADAENAEETLNAEDYLEQYGVSEEGFCDVTIDSDAESSIDFTVLNNLKIYTAEPQYEGEELMKKVSQLFYSSSDAYEVSQTDYALITDGMFTGWGDLYRYTDEDGNIFMSGSTFGTSYASGSVLLNVAEEEQLAFFENLIDEYHLGIWNGTDNSITIEQNTSGYVAQTYIDGLKLIETEGGTNMADKNGVRYTGGTVNMYISFDGQNNISAIFMYSAEITESDDLGVSYNNMEEIVNTIINSSSVDTGVVYHFDTASLVYNLGVTEDATYIFSPWMVLEGEAAYYFPTQENWDVSDKKLFVNLSTGDIYNE